VEVRVSVSWSPGFGLELKGDSNSKLWLRARTTPWLYIKPSITWFRPAYSFCSSCYFKCVLSSRHFVCLYTTVHLLLEQFIISLKSCLSTQSVCHISLRIGVRVLFWARIQSPGFVGPKLESESGVRNFLTPESGSQKIRTPHPWLQVTIAFCSWALIAGGISWNYIDDSLTTKTKRSHWVQHSSVHLCTMHFILQSAWRKHYVY